MPSPLAQVFASFYGGYVLPSYGQAALWMQRITDQTPGAVASASFDPFRQQVTSQHDGTYGVGWTVQQNGQTRYGYLAPQRVVVAIDDTTKLEQLTEQGFTIYEDSPTVSWAPPLVLTKGDLIAELGGSRRWVVGDALDPVQVNGTTVFNRAKLEARATNDIVYTVPLE